MERAGDLLKRFFEYHNLGKEGETYVSFFSSWTRIAGRDLAAHSQIADIRHNAAIIEVDHPAWMQILQMKQKSIVDSMKAQFPELGIGSIHMRLVDRAKWRGPLAADPEPNLSQETELPAGEEPAGSSDAAAATPESDSGPQQTSENSRLDALLDRLKKQVDARDRDRRSNQ